MKEKFVAKIDTRGSINVPSFLQKQKGFEPGVKVIVILELLEEKPQKSKQEAVACP